MKLFVRLVVIVSALGWGRALSIAQTPTADEQAFERVRRSLDRGAYADAERESQNLAGRLEAPGQASLDLARALDLLVEALIHNGEASAPATLARAEAALRMRERLAGRGHLATAVSLHNLATVHHERGEFMMALPLHGEGLSIRLKHLPSDDPAVADSLDELALTQMAMEHFEEARQTLARAQTIRETTSDAYPLKLARTLELVAWMDRYSGNYADAKAPLARALAIRRQLSADHPDMVSIIEVRGDLLWLEGDIAAARGAWVDGLSLAERVLGPDHPATAAFQRRLAAAAVALGDRVEGRRLVERGLVIAERSLAPCNPESISLLEDLASFQTYDGQYADAGTRYQEALIRLETCLGVASSRTATVVHNQALLAGRMGDLGQAERLHERAIRIWSAAHPPNQAYVARGLDALAEVVDARGQRERARVLYQRALRIRRETVGSDHPDVAWTLANLAHVNAESGNVKLALHQVEQAIDIYRRVGASDEPDHFARVLALRGDIQLRQGDYSSARSSFVEALSTRERLFGRTHPLAASARAEVASADFALGSSDAALSAALDAEQAGRDHLRFTVRYLPERLGLAYADKRPKGLNLALSILAGGRVEQPVATFDSVIRSRSLILDELGARARSAMGPDPELASLNGSLVAARRRFANLMLRTVDEGDSGARKMLDEARQQKEVAERALAERSVAVRGELARANVGIDEIQRMLPSGAALVSFVRYERTSFIELKNRVRTARTTPSYFAFVTRSGHSDVAAVPLGSARAIDALVTGWREQTTGILRASSPNEADRRYRAAGAALRQRVWDPIRPHLHDASTAFVVPDGTLNLVSFAALPIGGATYLIDKGPIIHYLSAERDLVSTDSVSTGSRGLLAVGGAAFDDATMFARATTPSLLPSRASNPGCATVQSLQFAPLAGTGREAHEVARLWTGSPADVLESRAATERAFKRDAPGHRVLHLATHGFFLGSDCTPATGGTRSVGGLAAAVPGIPAKPRLPADGLSDNPLLMSGLALAGANRRAAAGPDDEDGILTAEEVSAMNLEGVEWAVLSACDTGLGEIKAGEGVFGLRRAFQIAGARTVIMSLWSVDDQAARLWMRALYEGRLQKHLSTADAMHQASLGVLRARRARGQSTHPFFWAGFVATGDWR